MTVHMIGFDGRARPIADENVQTFLKKGWVRKPEGMTGDYNPIFDRRARVPRIAKKLKEVPVGEKDILEVVRV